MDQDSDTATRTELPGEWADTDRHPELPGEELGTFEMGGGVCLYDSAHPETYIVGPGVDLGEHA
jgi:hypothetical protein